MNDLDKLKNIMQTQELSVKQVARLVYVSDHTVYKWLQEVNPIDPARLELLEYKLK